MLFPTITLAKFIIILQAEICHPIIENIEGCFNNNEAFIQMKNDYILYSKYALQYFLKEKENEVKL